jgi:hypothetical protein
LPDVVELIGYLASALIVLSLLMASVLKLRVINLVGAVVFTLYGLLIDSVPGGPHQRRDRRHRRVLPVADVARTGPESYFEVVAWPTDGVYLPRFLAFHAEDIARSQPRFEGVRDDHLAFVVLRDAQPVGAVLVRDAGNGTAMVDLDYVIPAHRDFQAGAHVFGPHGPFASTRHPRGRDDRRHPDAPPLPRAARLHPERRTPGRSRSPEAA